MVITFAALYAVAAFRLIRWNAPRLTDGFGAAVLSLLVLSVRAIAVGVMVGGLWSNVMESARLGWTGHISERGFRIPWRHHYGKWFIGGLLLFWVIAVLDASKARRDRHASSRERSR